MAAVVLASTATAGDCVADLDGDGRVGGSDLGLLLVGWASPGPTDLDGDGTTGGSDLGIMLVDWNCEVSEPPTTPPLRLRASETILQTGVPTDIRFDVPVPTLIRETATSIALFEVDATGTPIGEALAALEDDPYDLPWDDVYMDGTYTASVIFDEPVDREFRIVAIADLGTTTITSQDVTFLAATFPTTKELEAEAHIYDAAVVIWEKSLAQFGDTYEAREATRTALLADPVVVDVLIAEDVIEIRLTSDLRFFITTSLNQKMEGGSGRLAGEPRRGIGEPVRFETASADQNESRIASGSSGCEDCTAIKNNRVLIWDPEEWFALCWSSIHLDFGECFDVEVLSGEACTVESIQTFSDYGTVVCFTHGFLSNDDTFFLTTGEVVDDHLSDNPAEMVGQVTTAMLSRDSTPCDFLYPPDNPYSVLVKAVNGEFFASRQIDLSSSVVFMSACKSAKPVSERILDVLTGRLGACAALGFTENTMVSWSPLVVNDFFSEMQFGGTVDEAFARIAGRNDGGNFGTRAPSFPEIELRNERAGDLSYEGVVIGLQEGGFESCNPGSGAWTYFNDRSRPAGAYPLYEANRPTEGDAMAVLAAGELHGWFEAGTRQKFCPGTSFDRVAFDWKVVWTPPKWLSPPGNCGSDPSVQISVTLSSGEGAELVVLDTDARLECGSFVLEGTNSQGDSIFGTPWIRLETDVSGFFAGIDPTSDQVTIEFRITEYQASGVLLIDDIEFIP